MIPIGRKIKILRTIHGITQEEVKERTGINRYLLIQIENGKIEPGDDLQQRLERLFGVNLDDARVEQAFRTLAPPPNRPTATAA